MSRQKWQLMWCGRKVERLDGPTYKKDWPKMGNEFPWLCLSDSEDDLLVVVPDWYLDKNGEWGCLQVGVKFDDLLDHFLDVCDDEEGYGFDRNKAILVLERAIEKIKERAVTTPASQA